MCNFLCFQDYSIAGIPEFLELATQWENWTNSVVKFLPGSSIGSVYTFSCDLRFSYFVWWFLYNLSLENCTYANLHIIFFFSAITGSFHSSWSPSVKQVKSPCRLRQQPTVYLQPKVWADRADKICAKGRIEVDTGKVKDVTLLALT